MAKRTISNERLKNTGLRIRWLREFLGHSQAEWAVAMGVSPMQLNKWEKGTRQPNIEVLIRVCGASYCTLDFIFRGVVGQDLHPLLRRTLAEAPNARLLQLSSPDGAAFSHPRPPPSPAPGGPKRSRRKSA